MVKYEDGKPTADSLWGSGEGGAGDIDPFDQHRSNMGITASVSSEYKWKF